MGDPRLLYHYCTLETFTSIIKNQTIWLTDVSMSNDSQELRWFKNEFYLYIAKKMENNPPRTIRKICEVLINLAIPNGYDVPYYGFILNFKHAKKANSFFDFSRCYAFCLSELGDSLGQWRGYANDGMGVSIGFKRKYFDIMNNASNCKKNQFIFKNVTYGNKNINEIFDQIFDFDDLNPSASSSEISFYTTRLLFITSYVAPFFKNPSFKEEKEWRVEYSINDYTFNNDIKFFQNCEMFTEEYKKTFDLPKINFQTRINKIIPHVELTLKEMPQVIDRIIIGPKSLVSENDIKLLLISQGFLSNLDDDKIKIIKSKSSYK